MQGSNSVEKYCYSDIIIIVSRVSHIVPHGGTHGISARRGYELRYARVAKQQTRHFEGVVGAIPWRCKSSPAHQNGTCSEIAKQRKPPRFARRPVCIELVRTHFVACGGEEFPANSERLRRKISKPPKSPEKQSAGTMF